MSGGFFRTDRCEHVWVPTANRSLDQCSKCGSLRHKAFVAAGADHATTKTHVTTH